MSKKRVRRFPGLLINFGPGGRGGPHLGSAWGSGTSLKAGVLAGGMCLCKAGP